MNPYTPWLWFFFQKLGFVSFPIVLLAVWLSYLIFKQDRRKIPLQLQMLRKVLSINVLDKIRNKDLYRELPSMSKVIQTTLTNSWSCIKGQNIYFGYTTWISIKGTKHWKTLINGSNRKAFKGIGWGGPGLEKMYFFILTYVVDLSFFFPKWALNLNHCGSYGRKRNDDWRRF